MNKDCFNFELIDKFTPDVVIKNSLEQVKEATNEYVIGNVEEYNGKIDSYTKTTPYPLSIPRQETVYIDIQENLGAMHSQKNKFEVFLSVKGLDHYKYRMMFIEYDDISYPVKVVLKEELAVEYNGKRNYILQIKSMAELEEMMNKIINSNTIISLLQSLIYEAIRHENNLSK